MNAISLIGMVIVLTGAAILVAYDVTVLIGVFLAMWGNNAVEREKMINYVKAADFRA